MKQLMIVLLVAVAAHAAADAGFEQYNQYNSAPSSGDYSYQQLQPKPSGLSAIWSKLTGSTTPNRRQGIFDEIDFSSLGLTIFFFVGGAILGVIGFSFLSAALSSSGRGLDTDEWEVDHSVWMDQLERDFEDSWSDE